VDVSGVRVGQVSLCAGEGPLVPGQGPVRTGITVILPHGGNVFREKAPAAVFTINGYGKAVGFEQVRELGCLEAPIALTNTLNVGKVIDALVVDAIRRNPGIGIQASTVNVVVGETNDGWLNDIQGRHVQAEQVWAALESASADPPELGSVGAGMGTICYGWKGGIGSASRQVILDEASFRLGALVQTNFGRRGDLVVLGVPVGKKLAQAGLADEQVEKGSVMVVLATDAPLDAHGLERLARRAVAGLARTGASLGGQSGDFVIAFSTANRIPAFDPGLSSLSFLAYPPARCLDRLFQAVVECVEEAVLDSLFCAETVAGRDGHLARELPVDPVLAWLKNR
jgi:D-aminopeptidase